MGRSTSVRAYTAVVVCAGIGVLLSMAARPQESVRRPVLYLVLLVLVVVGELWPVPVLRRGVDEVTISTPFTMAVLLLYGPIWAMWAMALASVVSDISRRKHWPRVLFNVAQLTLSIGAAGVVLQLAAPPGQVQLGGLAVRDVALLLAAGVVFCTVNNMVTAIVVALQLGVPVRAYLGKDLVFHASTSAVLLALAPVIVVAAQRSMLLLPLLLLPLAAVHRSARLARERGHAARHDPLTGLPNRGLFREIAKEETEDGRRHRQPVALLLFDLDRFKDVNDTLGHHVGDALLKAVGPRAAAAVGPGATVARLGGDEFGVVLPRVPGAAAARAAAVRLREAVSAPITVEGFALELGASVGVAVSPEHGDDVATLVRHADVAMYAAKRSGDGVAVYSPEDDRMSQQRLARVSELHRALREGELVLHYQPVADMRTGRVTGVEALLRWLHPRDGLLLPDEFVPLAEHTGLVHPLTTYVLDAGLAQLKAWRDAGADLHLAVNVSVRSLYDPTFAAALRQRLAAHEVPPEALVLELTERVVLVDPARARRVLGELAATGVRIAIDDFGTGYSSLAYLKNLPVSQVKIDKSFVLAMLRNDDDAVIVSSIIKLARNLGLAVVAEGVEQEPVWRRLAELGCDHAQGYWVSEPLPAGMFSARWLLMSGADGVDYAAVP